MVRMSSTCCQEFRESDDVKYFEDYEVRKFMEIYDGIYKSRVKDFKDIYRMGMEKYLERLDY